MQSVTQGAPRALQGRRIVVEGGRVGDESASGGGREGAISGHVQCVEVLEVFHAVANQRQSQAGHRHWGATADLSRRAGVVESAIAVATEGVDAHPGIRSVSAGCVATVVRRPTVVGDVVEFTLNPIQVGQPLEHAIARGRGVHHVRGPSRFGRAWTAIVAALVLVARLVPPDVLVWFCEPCVVAAARIGSSARFHLFYYRDQYVDGIEEAVGRGVGVVGGEKSEQPRSGGVDSRGAG